MSTYNSNQKVFSLSLLSNQLADRKGTKESLTEKITNDIHTVFSNNDMQAMIGNWDLVWGPVVYQNQHTKTKDASYADNTMYVAQEAGTENYVVAIAGTNPASMYGWLIEDFNVYAAVPWPFAADAKEKNQMISKGTEVGLQNLNNKMHDANGVSIQQFIQSLANKGTAIQLHVTGHSLGGALSPALALSIHDQLSASTRSNVTISVLSSAGPTIGNKELADYYNQRLGNNTQRFWNKRDMVPHAWEKKQLREIPWLYILHLKPSIFVIGLSVIARKMSSKYVYTQVNQSKPLHGKFHEFTVTEAYTDVEVAKAVDHIQQKASAKNNMSQTATAFVDKLLKKKFLKNQMNLFLSFMKQAGYQHVTEYNSLMNVEAYTKLQVELLGSMPPPDFKNRTLELILLIIELIIDSFSGDLEEELDHVADKLEDIDM